ncbi:MAG: hypothetical protein JXA74_01405, partial [Anaerolineae bacterium]|nr:hypothetical protein [Anaerolineae bacterium]
MTRRCPVALLTILVFCLAAAATAAQAPKGTAGQATSAEIAPLAGGLTLEQRAKLAPQVVKELMAAEKSAASRLRAPEPITFLVYLGEKAPLSHLARTPDLQSRRQAVVQSLQHTAERSQAAVISLLEARLRAGGVHDYRSYWVCNCVAVDGDLETALALARLPEVARIEPNRV